MPKKTPKPKINILLPVCWDHYQGTGKPYELAFYWGNRLSLESNHTQTVAADIKGFNFSGYQWATLRGIYVLLNNVPCIQYYLRYASYIAPDKLYLYEPNFFETVPYKKVTKSITKDSFGFKPPFLCREILEATLIHPMFSYDHFSENIYPFKVECVPNVQSKATSIHICVPTRVL